MQPNAKNLLEIADIKTPLIGLYDVPDTKPFEPFTKTKHCFFSAFDNWAKGESVFISEERISCMGAGYWLCGVESLPREKFVNFLANKEGLRSSPKIMNQWLDNQKPYKKKHPYIVIGPLKEEQYDYLKTITFFVNPDQLSLLLTGAEYHNSSIDTHQVISKFGSGCSQLVALFEDLDIPKAIIGATDIAMRQYLPSDILALTVTKPMFQQLCELDEDSFLYKPFWKRLKKSRYLK
ncbi:MAG: DUF169 domain-containing protein [Deltaproteobacteria bacterium]|jgi:hypothetical protein|nr:DUF169 domain-containing protein [Deltaproteobacteria bacterium]